MTGSARTAITNPTQLPPTNAASSAARAAYPGCTTEKWSVHAILLVLDVAAPRGRADARGESDPGRSRQEHLRVCLGRSLQRLRGGHGGVVRFLLHCAVRVAPSQK